MFGSIGLSVIQLFLQGLAYFQLRKQLLDADTEAALSMAERAPDLEPRPGGAFPGQAQPCEALGASLPLIRLETRCKQGLTSESAAGTVNRRK